MAWDMFWVCCQGWVQLVSAAVFATHFLAALHFLHTGMSTPAHAALVCSINIGLPHHAQYQASSYMLRMSQLQPQAFLKEDLDPCLTSSETTQQAV